MCILIRSNRCIALVHVALPAIEKTLPTANRIERDKSS